MLHFIRERAQSWFAWVIVMMIIIPFALWGVNQYAGGGGEIVVASVNGVDISQRQLQIAHLKQRQRLQDALGDNFRPELFPEERMKQQLLQELIEKELLVTTAGKAGFRVGNEQLADTIRNIPSLQDNGSFSNAAYEAALRRQGMTPGMFEQNMRRDLVAQQYYEGITETGFVTQREIEAYAKLRNQKRDIGYMVIPVSQYEGDVSVDDKEIASFYEENRDRFRVPEQVGIRYIELNAADIAAGISVSEEELRSRYDSQAMNYRTQEERHARHILIQLDEGANAEAVTAAEKTLLDLRERAEKGESFAELAREYSQDPGSAQEGGDLGFFGKGIMDPAFEQAAFALNEGEVSQPVRSAFGVHLILLEAIRPSETKSFEAVRGELLAELRRDRAEQLYYDKADALSNLTYEHPDTLELAAQELGLEIKTTGLFARNAGKGIAADPKVNGAAFSEEVLLRGNNSEALEVGKNHLVVLRLNEHQPEMVRPLDEVKDAVVNILTRNKARAKADEVAAMQRDRLVAGEEPEVVAQALNVEWQRVEITRIDTQIDPLIIDKAFSMLRPEEGKPRADQAQTSNGDKALIVLYSVKEGELQPEQVESFRAQLQRSVSDADFTAVLGALKAKADISIRSQ